MITSENIKILLALMFVKSATLWEEYNESDRPNLNSGSVNCELHESAYFLTSLIFNLLIGRIQPICKAAVWMGDKSWECDHEHLLEKGSEQLENRVDVNGCALASCHQDSTPGWVSTSMTNFSSVAHVLNH